MRKSSHIFLDVIVMKRGEKIITYIHIYYKPIVKIQYIAYDSCNTKLKKNIISYKLARHLCTIISDKNLNSRLSGLRYPLQQKKYPKYMQLLEHGINKVKCHDRNDLLKMKDKANHMLLHSCQHTNRKSLLKATFHFWNAIKK